MLSETRKRGQRFLALGIFLASVSMLGVMATVNSLQAEPIPETVVPLIYVADPIENRSGIEELLAERPNARDVCPSIEQKSELVGAFQICFVPERYVPLTAVRLEISESDLTELDVIRRTLIRQIGNAFTLIDLAPGDILQTNFLDSTGGIAPNMRAIGIAVNQVTSVGGTIRPGQHVDVLVSYERKGDSQSISVTEILLQDVEVISVFGPRQFFEQANQLSGEGYTPSYTAYEETRFTPDGEMMRDTTVTLAVPLEDAIRLTYMTNFAKEVRLITRRADDQQRYNLPPFTVAP